MISARKHTPVKLLTLILVACGPDVPQAPTGEEAYRRYRASGHGMEGKGDGPVAASLKRAPTDLTQLARRSGGRFDERYVMPVIDGRRHVAEHGPREMPVWGAVFEEELREERYPGWTSLLKPRTLVDYLRCLQQPRHRCCDRSAEARTRSSRGKK